MQLKKVIPAALVLLFFTTALHAQQSDTSLDSMNFYERVILELEQRGFPLTIALQNPEFIEQLELAGYRKDSLEIYLEKHKAKATNFPPEKTEYLSLVTKSYGDSIVLRWAPSTVDLWQRFNKRGYTVLRTELPADSNSSLDAGAETMVTLVDSLHAIKPWPLERIEKTIHPEDSAAMVVAQALYGETFGGDATEAKLDFVERNRIREMRFGFSMLMADRSALAAEVLGVRFVDKSVKPDHFYAYYVIPVGTPVEDLSMVAFSLQKNSKDANKKVTGLTATPTDGKVRLMWPKNENSFSEYWIERSADNGKTWKKLTPDVIVFMENEDIGPQTRLDDMVISTENNPAEEAGENCIFTDSTVNDINYSYRVSGQTPFGDFSDYAYVSATSKDQIPPPMPQIIRHEVDEKTNIASIEWSMNYDAELLKDLAGFSVWVTPHPDSISTQVSPVLPPGTRSYKSPEPLKKENIHYYILKAFDRTGNEISTFPLYMHVIDDIPPAPPVNPDYVIDSTGVVTLVWEHNTEPDFLGYRVYFANDLNDELTQLTPEPISVNMFRDTVQIVTLTEHIFYRIQAVDRSHNRSDFSIVVEVQKPDVLPPVAPILDNPVMNDTMIALQWKPSPSRDVEKHILYRRLYQQDSVWEQLMVLGPRDTFFRDETAIEEKLYEYSMQAVDDAGLLSEYAFPVKARRWFNDKVIGTVENLEAVYQDSSQSVRLSWTFTPPATGLMEGVDFVYSVYRSQGASPVLRYRTLDRQSTVFTDTKVKANEQYNYAVMVVFSNGKTSPLSALQSVQVKNQ